MQFSIALVLTEIGDDSPDVYHKSFGSLPDAKAFIIHKLKTYLGTGGNLFIAYAIAESNTGGKVKLTDDEGSRAEAIFDYTNTRRTLRRLARRRNK